MDIFELFKGGADTQGTTDARLLHGFANLRQLRLQCGKTQMAVGICEHGAELSIKRRLWQQAMGLVAIKIIANTCQLISNGLRWAFRHQMGA